MGDHRRLLARGESVLLTSEELPFGAASTLQDITLDNVDEMLGLSVVVPLTSVLKRQIRAYMEDHPELETVNEAVYELLSNSHLLGRESYA